MSYVRSTGWSPSATLTCWNRSDGERDIEANLGSGDCEDRISLLRKGGPHEVSRLSRTFNGKRQQQTRRLILCRPSCLCSTPADENSSCHRRGRALALIDSRGPGRSVSVRELRGFLCWMALVVLHLIQIPLLWFSFWEYVCRVGGDSDTDNHLDLRSVPVWVLWVFCAYHLRRQLLRRMHPSIADVMGNGEVFVCISISMTICANFSTLVYDPRAPLFDVGFYLIPAQGSRSFCVSLQNTMTVALPAAAILRILLIERRARCQLISAWLRLTSTTYAMRCLCVVLTSLPAPVVHCETRAGYSPLARWHDVATTLSPRVGAFKACGDLVFSGHAAWTTITALMLVKSCREAPPAAYLWIKVGGVVYVVLMCVCTIARRKHYSIDVILGVMIASLSSFRFQDGIMSRTEMRDRSGQSSAIDSRSHRWRPPALRRKLTADSLPPSPSRRANTSDDDAHLLTASGMRAVNRAGSTTTSGGGVGWRSHVGAARKHGGAFYSSSCRPVSWPGQRNRGSLSAVVIEDVESEVVAGVPFREGILGVGRVGGSAHVEYSFGLQP